MSKPRPFLRTYAAAVVLVGLGAYVYFVESKRPATSEKPKDKAFSLDKAKVKELTLSPQDGEAIRIVKDGKSWKLTAPREAPADDGAVDAVVASLESLEIETVAAENAANLADFGLEKPKMTVSVLLEGAPGPQTLLLGDKTPTGNDIYAMLPPQKRVVAVGAHVESSFDKKPFDLRDRDVLHVKREDIKTLEIRGPEGSYALVRKDKDKDEWAFSKPVETPAGRWSVSGLVGTIQSLRMESVASEEAQDFKPFGLDKPARTIVLGLESGGSKTLEIGAPLDGNERKPAPAGKASPASPASAPIPAGKPTKYYARDTGSRLVAVIPAAVVDDLAKGMGELRAKRLLEVATYEVEGFDVEDAGGKRVYTRSGGKDAADAQKWKRTAPDAKDLDTNKVQDVLFKVGGVEVQDFIDAPKSADSYGLDKPALKVTLRSPGGKPPAWFELGQKDGVTYARRVGDNAVLKLDAAKADELQKAFKEL
jgi:hypothetical protein